MSATWRSAVVPDRGAAREAPFSLLHGTSHAIHASPNRRLNPRAEPLESKIRHHLSDKLVTRKQPTVEV